MLQNCPYSDLGFDSNSFHEDVEGMTTHPILFDIDYANIRFANMMKIFFIMTKPIFTDGLFCLSWVT